MDTRTIGLLQGASVGADGTTLVPGPAPATAFQSIYVHSRDGWEMAWHVQAMNLEMAQAVAAANYVAMSEHRKRELIDHIRSSNNSPRNHLQPELNYSGRNR